MIQPTNYWAHARSCVLEYADHELICRLDSANQTERETIVAALNLLPVARDLIDEAMETHIYDSGEMPDKDCPYTAFLREANEVLN